jgi:hypothetical protein
VTIIVYLDLTKTWLQRKMLWTLEIPFKTGVTVCQPGDRLSLQRFSCLSSVSAGKYSVMPDHIIPHFFVKKTQIGKI